MRRKKGKFKQVMGFLLGLFMMVTLTEAIPVQALIESNIKSEKIYVGDGYEVTIKVTSQWDTAFNGEVILKNTSDKPIENWGLEFEMKNEITNVWNGIIKSGENGHYIIKNAEFNQDVEPGEKVSFGFTANGKVTELPEEFYLLGNLVKANSDEYTVKYDIDSDWGTGFSGKVTITNISEEAIEDWSLEFDLDNKINSIWNAYIDSKDEQHYVIKNSKYKQNIKAGESTSFGFMVLGGNSKNEMTNISLNKIVVEKSEDVIDPLLSDYNALRIGYYAGDSQSSVTHNITLIDKGENESLVEWSSSDESLIDSKGNVFRPSDEGKDVKLTATLSLNGKTLVKEFDLKALNKKNIDISKIKDLSVSDLEEMNKDYNNYDVEVGQFGYINHVYGSYSDLKIDSYEDALYSLYSLKTAMGLKDPFKELEPFNTKTDETGSIYKFNQMYKGVPVFSNTLVVSADREGKTDYLLSEYFPIEGEISTTPSKTYDEGIEYVKEEYSEGTVYVEEDEGKRLYIYNYHGKGELVWKAYFDLSEDSNEMKKGRYEVLVSAVDGEIIYVNSISKDLSSIETSGVDLKDEKRTFTITKNLPFIFDDYMLEDRERNISIYNGKGDMNVLPVKLPYTSDKKDDWTSEQVSAMANMKEVYDFYLNIFNRISYDDAWWQASGDYVYIHLDTGIEDNAGWIGGGIMAIGRGTGKNGAYEKKSFAVGADIICHEFTHGVVGYETSLDKIYYGTPGAINEAYSDIFACFKDGDWKIGEDLTWGEGMRNVADPNRTSDPSSVSGTFYVDYKTETTDKAGVHINSNIISHAAYLMNENGMNMDQLQKLWYQSLCLGYSKHSDFYDIRLKVLQAANKLSFSSEEIDIINDAFDEVNILQSNCDETDESYFNDLDAAVEAENNKEEDEKKYVTLSGSVFDADTDTAIGNNKGLEGVNVTGYSFDYLKTYATTKTNENGGYSLRNEEAKEYLLTYEKEGYLPTIMYKDKINEVVQNNYPCEPVELIPWEYNGLGAASGKIISAATGKGVGGLTLNVRLGMNNIYSNIITTIQTDEEGNYSIEAMMAGNYCLEIVDNSGSDNPYISTFMNIKILGDTSIKDQNGVISSSLEKDQVRVVLSWGSKPRDLDSHMICDLSDSSKGHVYYSSKNFYNKDELVCKLDIDDVDGYGPETTTIYNNQTGIYTFYVYNYGNEDRMDISDATVKVYMNGAAYPAYTFNIPKGDGRYWNVFKYNGATNTIRPINVVADREMS